MFTKKDIISLKYELKKNIGNNIVITLRGGVDKRVKEYKIEAINKNFVLLTRENEWCVIRECFSYNSLITHEFYIIDNNKNAI